MPRKKSNADLRFGRIVASAAGFLIGAIIGLMLRVLIEGLTCFCMR